MSDERRRAVLEQIAYGSDATPHDRIRALEQLAELDGERKRDELRGIADEELRRELDDLTAANLTLMLEEGAATDYPRKLALLDAELERRVRQRIAEIESVAEIEAEIERRAAERARAMYRARAFEVVRRTPQEAAHEPESVADDAEPAPEPKPLRSPQSAPEEQDPAWRLRRGWRNGDDGLPGLP